MTDTKSLLYTAYVTTRLHKVFANNRSVFFGKYTLADGVFQQCQTRTRARPLHKTYLGNGARKPVSASEVVSKTKDGAIFGLGPDLK